MEDCQITRITAIIMKIKKINMKINDSCNEDKNNS